MYGHVEVCSDDRGEVSTKGLYDIFTAAYCLLLSLLYWRSIIA